MSRFRNNRRKQAPSITTQSLTDIVFMLLFFLMVTTHLRDTSSKLQIKKPQSAEQIKNTKRSLLITIYIGKPQEQYAQQFGKDYCVQLNDKIARVTDIADFINQERKMKNPNDLPYLTISLRIDKEAPMGIVNDVKKELRKVNALRVSYSTDK